ncbi:MAG: alpha/beta hydrolase, partial [Actinomycetes bacterium]
IERPELVRKLIVSSVSFHPDGDRPENKGAVSELTVEMIAGTPMEQEYRAKSPNPDKLLRHGGVNAALPTPAGDRGLTGSRAI